MKTILKTIVEAVDDFAKARNWPSDNYSIFVRVLEEWGRTSFILVVRDLGGQSTEAVWSELFDHFEDLRNRGADLGPSLGFMVLERDQVEHGGLSYSIPESYVDIEDLLPSLKLAY